MLHMPKIIYTKNWAILLKIEGGVDFFAGSWVIIFFLPNQQKNDVFRPKNGQFLTIFGENFRNHRNHLNTLYDQFLGQLKHFWA